MPRNTPAEMKAQARAQKALMEQKLQQKRAAQKAEAKSAQKQAVKVKKAAQTAAQKQAKKQLEMALMADLQKMIYHMKTAQQHWVSAMKIFANAQIKIANAGFNPKQTNFYKHLSYIDDVYEGMGIFINNAKETLKLG